MEVVRPTFAGRAVFVIANCAPSVHVRLMTIGESLRKYSAEQDSAEELALENDVEAKLKGFAEKGAKA